MNEPATSSRLGQLMDDYKRQNGIVQRSSNTNTLANISADVEERTFDDLSSEEKTIVLSKINEVDYLQSASILQFGDANESIITQHAEVIISKYSAEEAGDVTNPLTDLVATLKSNNPNEIVGKVNKKAEKEYAGALSSFLSIISMKNLKKKLAKELAEHSTITSNIDTIRIELKKQQMNLQKDIAVYEEMGRNTCKQVNEFELDCIALDLMIDDAQHKIDDLKALKKLSLIQMNQLNSLNSAIERMERRKATIQTIRVSTIQSMPQLAVLIKGDEIICEKIDEVETLVIPLWTWQYAIAVGALKQQEALDIQKTIRGITSKLLTGDAKMLHDNMIAAQNELYAAAVAVDDLVTVQNYIDDMVTQVNASQNEARKKSVEEMKKLREIEQKNYALMSNSLNTSENPNR